LGGGLGDADAVGDPAGAADADADDVGT